MPQSHRGTEQRRVVDSEITEQIIGAAIAIHRVFGPGLLEGVYEECAAEDALQPFGVKVREMPLSPSDIRAMIRSVGRLYHRVTEAQSNAEWLIAR